MGNMHWAAIILVASKKGALRWLISIGGPGLILLGLADNSFILRRASTDLATVLLAAHHSEMWFYYAFMATAGSILGGYFTYHMARKGGQKDFGEVLAEEGRYGICDFLNASASRRSSSLLCFLRPSPLCRCSLRRRFTVSNQKISGRPRRGASNTVHYHGLSWSALRRHITTFFARYYWPVLLVFIAFVVLGGLYGLFKYKRGQARE